jgi:DNA-binding transcriptional ArsR family regulator
MLLPQPDADKITLAGVLAALGDETRLAIVASLAGSGQTCMPCGQFKVLTSKSNLTYHISKLREAGVVQVEPKGTRRYISLRRDDLEHRFPGLLQSIVATTADLPPVTDSDWTESAEPAPAQ